MITTLCGADSYRRLKKLNELINFFVAKRGAFSHERLNLKAEEDFARVKAFLNTASMFGSKKLLVLDDPFEYPDAKGLKKVLQGNTETNDTNIVINTEKKFSPPFRFLTEAPNVFYEFKKLEGKELDEFIKKEASRSGLQLVAVDIFRVKEIFGADTWRISTELEQLSLASSQSIKNPEAPVDYFKNLDDIKHGTTADRRLIALEKLTSGARYDAERLFNGLAFRLTNEVEAETYADYNAATRAGRLDYEEVLLAIALGLRFNPLDW